MHSCAQIPIFKCRVMKIQGGYNSMVVIIVKHTLMTLKTMAFLVVVILT